MGTSSLDLHTSSCVQTKGRSLEIKINRTNYLNTFIPFHQTIGLGVLTSLVMLIPFEPGLFGRVCPWSQEQQLGPGLSTSMS
jgi:hypothetical protein